MRRKTDVIRRVRPGHHVWDYDSRVSIRRRDRRTWELDGPRDYGEAGRRLFKLFPTYGAAVEFIRRELSLIVESRAAEAHAPAKDVDRPAERNSVGALEFDDDGSIDLFQLRCARCGVAVVDHLNPTGQERSTITVGREANVLPLLICSRCAAGEIARIVMGLPTIDPSEWPVGPRELELEGRAAYVFLCDQVLENYQDPGDPK